MANKNILDIVEALKLNTDNNQPVIISDNDIEVVTNPQPKTEESRHKLEQRLEKMLNLIVPVTKNNNQKMLPLPESGDTQKLLSGNTPSTAIVKKQFEIQNTNNYENQSDTKNTFNNSGGFFKSILLTLIDMKNLLIDGNELAKKKITDNPLVELTKEIKVNNEDDNQKFEAEKKQNKIENDRFEAQQTKINEDEYEGKNKTSFFSKVKSVASAPIKANESIKSFLKDTLSPSTLMKYIISPLITTLLVGGGLILLVGLVSLLLKKAQKNWIPNVVDTIKNNVKGVYDHAIDSRNTVKKLNEKKDEFLNQGKEIGFNPKSFEKKVSKAKTNEDKKELIDNLSEKEKKIFSGYLNTEKSKIDMRIEDMHVDKRPKNPSKHQAIEYKLMDEEFDKQLLKYTTPLSMIEGSSEQGIKIMDNIKENVAYDRAIKENKYNPTLKETEFDKSLAETYVPKEKNEIFLKPNTFYNNMINLDDEIKKEKQNYEPIGKPKIDGLEIIKQKELYEKNKEAGGFSSAKGSQLINTNQNINNATTNNNTYANKLVFPIEPSLVNMAQRDYMGMMPMRT